MNDEGWGCAYRSLQTVLSYFKENGLREAFEMPSIRQIQQILVDIGDKQQYFVGSKEWIGAFEVSYVLQKVIQCECRILHVRDGGDISNYTNDFKTHFLKEGTPVMFGGGVKAFTLLGIDVQEDKDEEFVRYLILDPHYTGQDTVSKSVEKGGIQWMGKDIFQNGIFYNFCMPFRK